VTTIKPAIVIRNLEECEKVQCAYGFCLPLSILSAWYELPASYWAGARSRGAMREMFVDGQRWGVVSEARAEVARLRKSIKEREISEGSRIVDKPAGNETGPKRSPKDCARKAAQ